MDQTGSGQDSPCESEKSLELLGTRRELQKTRLLILMQGPSLEAVMASLVILLHRRQLHRVKFGLIIVLVLWAEHILVFAWGRFSLDWFPSSV